MDLEVAAAATSSGSTNPSGRVHSKRTICGAGAHTAGHRTKSSQPPAVQYGRRKGSNTADVPRVPPRKKSKNGTTQNIKHFDKEPGARRIYLGLIVSSDGKLPAKRAMKLGAMYSSGYLSLAG